MIVGKTKKEWIQKHPIIKKIIDLNEVFWLNPKLKRFNTIKNTLPLTLEDIKKADARLKRFAPFIAKKFPETREENGIIESNLEKINGFKSTLDKIYNTKIRGNLYIKCDHKLPIAGSIKARGGIYEVLKHAEDLALKEGMLSIKDNYSILAEKNFKDFFSQYSLAVGSTGNLGISIGISGAALGFKTTVHMSRDAKEWKKKLLRNHGVKIVEYESDFSKAVEKGRKEARLDPSTHFVDDEKSKTLFLGYAVAALRLQKQLEKEGQIVDKDHPLIVYLPCGVGGSPGGICFGLKMLFGDNVHCFFAEPTHSPAMLLGMITEKHNKISVQDFGIDNITEADGLAVGTPSSLVGRLMDNLLSGIYTLSDDILYALLTALKDKESFELEPSAIAGFAGPAKLFRTGNGYKYIKEKLTNDKLKKAAHIAWATGGCMVPKHINRNYYQKGKNIINTQLPHIN